MTNERNTTQSILSTFEELLEVRKVHPRKLIVAHLNINSLKSKFDEIQDVLNETIVDLLFISETKLDSSYRDGLFETPGYKFESAIAMSLAEALQLSLNRIFLLGDVET